MIENIEIWKDIDGYENKYEISTFGRVKSVKNNLIMKPMIARNGYLIACLWKNNKQSKVCIHRLVAQAFIPNPNNYPEINHIDENKENNNVENLEWCTHVYNLNYGNVKKKIGKANKNKITTDETRQKLREDSSRKRWINNGINEKFVRIEQLDYFFNNGWNKGRIFRRRTND